MVPKTLSELGNHKWYTRHYALYYSFGLREYSSTQNTKHYLAKNIRDTDSKVKQLLKEVRTDANKALQQESVGCLQMQVTNLNWDNHKNY